MTELVDALDRLVPLQADAEGDWQDVLRRAAPARAQHRVPRILALAAALAAALALAGVATPLGRVVGHAVADFSGWLRGAPGYPVSAQEQAEFERTHRSWAAFPEGVRLRRLVTLRRGGFTFTLYGFRDGDSLCIEVGGTGRAAGPTFPSCAPLRDLRRQSTPALPLVVDLALGGAGDPQRVGDTIVQRHLAVAQAGIVADGVRSVVLRSTDGTRRAKVAHDAYLSVDIRPPIGTALRHIAARSGRETLDVPFAPQASWLVPGSAATPTLPRTVPGPAHVDHPPRNLHIGWLERGELRGDPIPRSRGSLRFFRRHFGRLIQPDPADRTSVALAINQLPHLVVVCSDSGCFRPRELFRQTPFSWTLEGGDQFDRLVGVASDEVARMRIFLANGLFEPVSLRDNVFVGYVPRVRYPAKLVAYDRDGKVIGMQAFGLRLAPQPVRGARWRTLVRRVSHGAVLFVKTAPGTQGSTCFAMPIWRGCGDTRPCCGAMQLVTSAVSRELLMVDGLVRPDVRIVELRAGRQVLRMRPVQGFVVGVLAHVRTRRWWAVARDASGKVVGKEYVRPLRP